MSRKLLFFTVLFFAVLSVLVFFSCGSAHAQIFSFGRSKTTPPPAPKTVSPLVLNESDRAAAIVAREEMLKSLKVAEPQSASPQGAYNSSYRSPALIQDERQIAVEVRFIVTLPELIAPTGFTTESGWQSVPSLQPQDPMSRYSECLEKHPTSIGSVHIVETYSPVLFRFIDDKNGYEFMSHVMRDSRSNILQAPKVTLFNGQSGSVSDQTITPFVTGFSGGGDRTDITLLDEGQILQLTAEIQEDGSVFLKQCNIIFRKIINKDNPLSLDPRLHSPTLRTDCVKMPVRIPQGKSLLVAMPGWESGEEIKRLGIKTASREKQILCALITTRIIESEPVQEWKPNGYASENLRAIQGEWERFWMSDQPYQPK